MGNNLDFHHVRIQAAPIRILAEEVLVTAQQVLGVDRTIVRARAINGNGRVDLGIPTIKGSRPARRAEFEFAEDATLGNDLNLHHIWIQGTPIRILAEKILVAPK